MSSWSTGYFNSLTKEKNTDIMFLQKCYKVGIAFRPLHFCSIIIYVPPLLIKKDNISSIPSPERPASFFNSGYALVSVL